MIFLLYSIILAFIIPFISFIFPYIYEMIIDTETFPTDIALNIFLPLIISILFYAFHLQNTTAACDTRNKTKAGMNSLYTFLLLIIWVMCLDYYPGILSPFQNLISENIFVLYLSKYIMIYALVYLLLTYTSFESIKETCKINIKQIKEVYQRLENALN